MTDDKGGRIDITDSALWCAVGDSKALHEQAAAFQAGISFIASVGRLSCSGRAHPVTCGA